MEKSLQLEWMRPENVQSELRINGEEHLKEIKKAWLEPNGQVSVVKNPPGKPLKKEDKRLFG